MSKKLIYIADDEINICNIIKSFLIKEGYNAEAFFDGTSVYNAFCARPADMLIIDVMMPGMDGYSLCSAVRSISSVPIIIVSARDGEPDKITGLALGSDDYLTKPFSPIELIARVKSIFRRIEMDKAQDVSVNTLKINDVVLNPDSKRVEVNGKPVVFTGMEFSLLYYLARNTSRGVSRSELLDKVWGFESEVETRATDDMIKRIRKKLSDSGSNLKIETIWGFGFKIHVEDMS